MHLLDLPIADKVTRILEQLHDYLPEAVLAFGMLLLIVMDLILPTKRSKSIWRGLFTISILAATFIILMYNQMSDEYSIFVAIKFILLLGTTACVILMMLEDTLMKPGEHFTMLLSVLLGSFFLVNSKLLLTFYISLEMISISAYILTVMKFDKYSTEAGLKYLLFGATSSAIMLFGISLVYGFSGTMALHDIDLMIRNVGLIPTVAALAMIAVGLLFKVAAIPMHIWAPDVYQSANTSTVAYLSTIPKITGIVAFLIVLTNCKIPQTWVEPTIGIVSMLTMVLSNTAALAQKDIKRMLAYSSIAHTGFLLIPIVINNHTAWQGFIFYSVIYIVMNIGAFACILQINNTTGTTDIKRYSGLGRSMPITGLMLLVIMVALTGLPPTAGFIAKLFLFTALWEAYSSSGNLLLVVLLCIAAVNAVISLFYYLKVPYYMYIKDGQAGEEYESERAGILNYLIAVLVLVLLLLFFKPDWLMKLIYNINFVV